MYAHALYYVEKSDYYFISKYANYFEQLKTDDDLRNAVFSAFGVQINADEFNKLMSIIKNVVIDLSYTNKNRID